MKHEITFSLYDLRSFIEEILAKDELEIKALAGKNSITDDLEILHELKPGDRGEKDEYIFTGIKVNVEKRQLPEPKNERQADAFYSK